MTPKIQELRQTIARNEAAITSIDLVIAEINNKESKLFRQMLDGGLDSNKPEIIKQKLEQFEASREDKNSLLKSKTELIEEKNAAMEEMMNLFRIEFGMHEIKDIVGSDIPQKEEPEAIRSRAHPGTVPPIVSGGKK